MNECILVVDDDREIVGAIAIVLEREGYTVRRAYDGLGAVEQALDPAVRLILIDVMMPKLDGLSALMRIREKRNLPVIVLSAKSEDTDKILGLSMGADDYVTKPYNPQELAARVRSQLRRYTLLGDVHAEKREGEIVNGRTLSRSAERSVIYALCKRTKRFIQNQNKDGFQPHQTPACLLRQCGRGGDSGLSADPWHPRQYRGDVSHAGNYAPGVPAGDV